MNVRICIAGSADDVHFFTERLKAAVGDFSLSVSRDYPQIPRDNKEIAVYITVQEER